MVWDSYPVGAMRGHPGGQGRGGVCAEKAISPNAVTGALTFNG